MDAVSSCVASSAPVDAINFVCIVSPLDICRWRSMKSVMTTLICECWSGEDLVVHVRPCVILKYVYKNERMLWFQRTLLGKDATMNESSLSVGDENVQVSVHACVYNWICTWLQVHMIAGAYDFRCTWLQVHVIASAHDCRCTWLQVRMIAGAHDCRYTWFQVHMIKGTYDCRYTWLKVHTIAGVHDCRCTWLQVHMIAGIHDMQSSVFTGVDSVWSNHTKSWPDWCTAVTNVDLFWNDRERSDSSASRSSSSLKRTILRMQKEWHLNFQSQLLAKERDWVLKLEEQKQEWQRKCKEFEDDKQKKLDKIAQLQQSHADMKWAIDIIIITIYFESFSFLPR